MIQTSLRMALFYHPRLKFTIIPFQKTLLPHQTLQMRR